MPKSSAPKSNHESRNDLVKQGNAATAGGSRSMVDVPVTLNTYWAQKLFRKTFLQFSRDAHTIYLIAVADAQQKDVESNQKQIEAQLNELRAILQRETASIAQQLVSSVGTLEGFHVVGAQNVVASTNLPITKKWLYCIADFDQLAVELDKLMQAEVISTTEREKRVRGWQATMFTACNEFNKLANNIERLRKATGLKMSDDADDDEPVQAKQSPDSPRKHPQGRRAAAETPARTENPAVANA